jgi:hypothetical protein|tara:strand:+ start:481 stop:639 length:159 start_codon:yes stop_codon:yes gene_type:complete
MDKFGWQRPNIEVGKTGIQQAAEVRKMRKQSEAINVVVQGNLMADTLMKYNK